MIKTRRRKRGVAVPRRLVQGTEGALVRLLALSQDGGVLNTAYMERLNVTFRARLAALVRRTRSLFCRVRLLRAGMYWVGTVYNFCMAHASLMQRDGRRWTPAMAAGITNPLWSVAELLGYRVPPPLWRPPKRPERPSRARQRSLEQWAT